MDPILVAKDLTKSFGAVVAAGDINVKVHEHEFVAVIGANGAGKTTFINMVTGYLKPSAGEIFFRGEAITGLAPRQVTKKGVCRSFQVAQLFPDLTVLENMMIAFSVLKDGGVSGIKPLHNPEAEAHSLAVLEEFGIAEHAGSQVATLAQGVRKLLDIAMAMVSRPPLLLLDEPTSGVAIEEKFPLMDTVMAGIKKSGAAVLFVEHDMDIVEKYAKRVIAFYDGRIIADGPTAEALSHPQVKEFIVGEDFVSSLGPDGGNGSAENG